MRTLSRSLLLAVATVGLAASAHAQGPRRAQPQPQPVITMRADGIVQSPAPHQVFQRDANGTAEIPVALDAAVKDAKNVRALVSGGFSPFPVSPPFVDGKLVGVPTGGPYTITVQYEQGNAVQSVPVGPVYVGDLWVLAGQSNMEGVGDLVDVTPPDPRVSALGMDGKWGQAAEPLHWLVDSPDPVHSGDPANRAERSAQQHKTRTKGAGLGLPFAVEMVRATGVPIGLVTAAHGGTSMQQWDPARKGEGGNSLYGSMLRQVQLAGGRVKGVLWYQGESDSSPEGSQIFERVFADFVAAVRNDLGQADLPFYYVQIGRFVTEGDPAGWNRVQEAQRVLPDRLANTAVVSVIDLELDDGIHVGTQGLKRAGARLAKIAQRQLFGQIGASTPTFDRVAVGPNGTLEVKFRGVNLGVSPGVATVAADGTIRQNAASAAASGLQPETHIAGFSIRKGDGSPIPMIFEARVGRSRDSVVLKLTKPVPPGSFLWYGHGYDPYANLTDGADMAVPVFGPIALDPVTQPAAPVAAAPAPAPKPEEKKAEAASVKALIITGDEVGAHDWKATHEALKKILADGGKIAVDVTTTPNKDLTDENLAKYDVLVLNYRDTDKGAPETKWSDANKEAFLKAVRDGGKGLVSYHFSSSAFTSPNWEEYEKALGGWRKQGFHGPPHAFKVKKTDAEHPVSAGLPAEFDHVVDELYQNSMLPEGAVVLATAYSDPEKPKGTGKDEPVIWVNQYGKGRVFSCVLGHDVAALNDPHVAPWLRRGTIWAATGKVE
ncbi:sialate O-acetylesterase [Planctomyces sp. SH-PL62]|uniref:sialate O-acetylesterase n=1 Tax=Planctomyces sp. SH-PL62 TaxID=1636152 RepID=UPI00078BF5F2|nr:sialate O-acetylesterase [Planctomyces sp. SH-PL62]AMV37966.1 Trehalose utilization [Planctomyces sp. SH-PL62]